MPQQYLHHQSQQPTTPINFLNQSDKKPSYSSISNASFGFFPQQPQTSLSAGTSTLSPAQTVQSISNSSLAMNNLNSQLKGSNSSNIIDSNNNNLDSNNEKTNLDKSEIKQKNDKETNIKLPVNEFSETNHLDNNDKESSTNDDYSNLMSDDYSNETDKNELNFSQSSDLQQFNISYEEITDKVEIGRGRFGIVYRAYWHGLIAIKEIDYNQIFNENSDELKNFKEEVLNLRKTRHSNLILFIGACINPPKCAIVMSLCRGVSLHKYLHTESSSAYSKINLDWNIDICTQIAQALGYLHNKQMIHKDLRSKNVFIDGCKAVITDFGLYSIRKLCSKPKRNDLLPITKECVYYMAPEIVKLIGTDKIESAFSQASDVFAFG